MGRGKSRLLTGESVETSEGNVADAVKIKKRRICVAATEQ